MCCSGDSTAQDLEKTQAAFTSTLNSAYSTMFANQQATLAKLTAQLNQAVNNPQGFSAQDLAAMRTTTMDQTTQQFARAQVAANAKAAAEGGADLGSGVAAGISAGIQAQGAEAQAAGQEQITLANEQLKQQNYWRGISGLENLGGMENPTSIAGAEAGVANSATNAGQLVLSSEQAGWGDIGGVISGIAGLGAAAGGVYKDLYPHG